MCSLEQWKIRNCSELRSERELIWHITYPALNWKAFVLGTLSLSPQDRKVCSFLETQQKFCNNSKLPLLTSFLWTILWLQLSGSQAWLKRRHKGDARDVATIHYTLCAAMFYIQTLTLTYWNISLYVVAVVYVCLFIFLIDFNGFEQNIASDEHSYFLPV